MRDACKITKQRIRAFAQSDTAATGAGRPREGTPDGTPIAGLFHQGLDEPSDVVEALNDAFKR